MVYNRCLPSIQFQTLAESNESLHRLDARAACEDRMQSSANRFTIFAANFLRSSKSLSLDAKKVLSQKVREQQSFLTTDRSPNEFTRSAANSISRHGKQTCVESTNLTVAAGMMQSSVRMQITTRLISSLKRWNSQNGGQFASFQCKFATCVWQTIKFSVCRSTQTAANITADGLN